MTTTTRAEINRRNAQKSTGPRTPEGKERSRLNAVKHGLSATIPVLPGEDPDAFRHRLETWADALAPGDVVEQFLVEQAATASWKIERADRVEAARLAAAVRDADAERQAGRREEADRLGQVLLGRDGLAPDPDLAQEVLQILDPGVQARPDADGRDPLRSILDRLESCAEGCAWLLARWAELRAPLERDLDWNEDQLVEAVRLSGRQPLNMTPEGWNDYMESRFFGDVEEPGPGDDEDLDEEQQIALDAAIEAQVEAEDRRRLTQQLVEVLPDSEAVARAALLGVVERASGRLTALAAAHEARWEAEAVERAERMSFDTGPEDERLWRYQFGCGRSLRRTLDTLLKLRREDRGAGRGARGKTIGPARRRPCHTRPETRRTRASRWPSRNRGCKTKPPQRPSRNRRYKTKPSQRPSIIPALKTRPPTRPSHPLPLRTKPAHRRSRNRRCKTKPSQRASVIPRREPEPMPRSGSPPERCRPCSSPPSPCSHRSPPPDSPRPTRARRASRVGIPTARRARPCGAAVRILSPTRTSAGRPPSPGHHRSRPGSHATSVTPGREAARQPRGRPRFPRPIASAHSPPHFNHSDGSASDGIRQSPRGERLTVPTFGPSGTHDRLNWFWKNRV